MTLNNFAVANAVMRTNNALMRSFSPSFVTSFKRCALFVDRFCFFHKSISQISLIAIAPFSSIKPFRVMNLAWQRAIFMLITEESTGNKLFFSDDATAIWRRKYDGTIMIRNEVKNVTPKSPFPLLASPSPPPPEKANINEFDQFKVTLTQQFRTCQFASVGKSALILSINLKGNRNHITTRTTTVLFKRCA